MIWCGEVSLYLILIYSQPGIICCYLGLLMTSINYILHTRYLVPPRTKNVNTLILFVLVYNYLTNLIILISTTFPPYPFTKFSKCAVHLSLPCHLHSWGVHHPILQHFQFPCFKTASCTVQYCIVNEINILCSMLHIYVYYTVQWFSLFCSILIKVHSSLSFTALSSVFLT